MEDNTEELSNKTFRTRQLSPFHNFTQQSLSQKERALSTVFCQRLELMDITRNSRNKKQAQGEIKELTITSLNLPDVPTYDQLIQPIRIKIEIHLFSDSSSFKNEFVLLPASKQPKVLLDLAEDIAFYPLLLYRASSDVVETVLYWLEHAYLSPARNFIIPNTNLTRIINICIESFHYVMQEIEDGSNEDAIMNPVIDALPDVLKLEYQTSSDDISKISLDISRQEALEICKQLPERALFYKAFLNHVVNTTSIRLSSHTLYHVSYSSFAVRKDGCFKITADALKDDAIDLLKELVQAAEQQAYQLLY
ncbi:hypothetical protein EDC96DRAFT_521491 [Choanephora cucurbitarum]|nr:hypothetical protein EDC96DRAFT_521491 [Choanephora cucurbitarum]